MQEVARVRNERWWFVGKGGGGSDGEWERVEGGRPSPRSSSVKWSI